MAIVTLDKLDKKHISLEILRRNGGYWQNWQFYPQTRVGWQCFQSSQFHDDLYLLDRIMHTKIPLPDRTLARCLTPLGMNIVDGEETL